MSEQHPFLASNEAPEFGIPLRITPREKEILRLISEGLTDQEIARRLWVSRSTVRTHLVHLREKLHVHNRVALVRAAERLGLIRNEVVESTLVWIGGEPRLGYTPDQEVAPKPSPEQTGGGALADEEGETEMLNPRLRFWYLAALLALVAENGAAVAEAAKSARLSRAAVPCAAVGYTPPATAGMTSRRLCTFRDADPFVAPAPNGRYLSFVDWETGDLALHDVATGKSRRLTKKGSWHDSGEWAESSRISPDGRRVAYTWMNQQGWFYELRLIGTNGTRPRVLYPNPEHALIWLFDWSPNGKQILARLARKDRTYQIVSVAVADGSVRVLKTLGQANGMCFSPDGRTIAYDLPSHAGSPERDIYLLATDGSGETRLVQHPANDTVVGWAPDGKSLLFASDRTGTQGIWVMRVTDRNPQGSPELVKREMGSWSALRVTRNGALYYSQQTGIKEDVYTATLDPSTGKLLTPPQSINPRLVGANSHPAWSPDGRYLAYLSPQRDALRARESPRILAIRSVESGETRELALQRPVGQPSWSADGRFLLAAATDDVARNVGRREVFRIDAESGTATAIAEADGAGAHKQPGVWAPDGKVIFYRASDQDFHVLRVRNLTTGQEQELYRADGIRAGTLAIAADGRRLAFAAEYDGMRTKTIKVMPAAGGEPRELLRDRGDTIWSLTWMPDGRHLLFVRDNEVWRLPVAGGEPQRVGLTMNGLRSLSVHPNGQRIAFTAGSPEFEVWVMDNLFAAAPTANAAAPRR